MDMLNELNNALNTITNENIEYQIYFTNKLLASMGDLEPCDMDMSGITNKGKYLTLITCIAFIYGSVHGIDPNDLSFEEVIDKLDLMKKTVDEYKFIFGSEPLKDLLVFDL